MPAPHRVVDKILDGAADGVVKLVDSAMGGLKGAGEDVMSALDEPFKDMTGKVGPHRIIDAAVDGVASGIKAAYTGFITALKNTGEGISEGLDNPPEQIGLPPKDIGRIGPK